MLPLRASWGPSVSFPKYNKNSEKKKKKSGLSPLLSVSSYCLSIETLSSWHLGTVRLFSLLLYPAGVKVPSASFEPSPFTGSRTFLSLSSVPPSFLLHRCSIIRKFVNQRIITRLLCKGLTLIRDTVDSWTTQIWTSRVHLYENFQQ